MFNLKEIESNYSKFSDLKIEEIVRKGGRDLRPEVIPILKNELEKRGMGTSSFAWIDAESSPLSESEIHDYQALIEQVGCGLCEQKNKKIRAFRFEKFSSWLSDGMLVREDKFCCLECAEGLRNRFLKQNLLFGFWSARGIVWTPIVAFYNFYNRSTHRIEKLNQQITQDYLDEHRGKLRLSKDPLAYLTRSIKDFNQEQ